MKRFLLILTLVFAAACGTANRASRPAVLPSHAESPSTWRVVERVWKYSRTHPDGFTLSVSTMEAPTEGISVAYAATQDCHSKEGLEYVVSHSLEHDGYVGGWLDTADSLYYFDSVRIFPESQRDSALSFARRNGQIAVYILSSGEEIRLQ